jgi:hypothetical protein
MQLNTVATGFAKQLAEAGVSTTLRPYVGAPRRPHVFVCINMVGRSKWALDAFADCVQWTHVTSYHRRRSTGDPGAPVRRRRPTLEQFCSIHEQHHHF